jgi:hypothetical protein
VASADAVFLPRSDQALATGDINRWEDRGEIIPVTLASTSRHRWIAAEHRFQPWRRRGARGEDAPMLHARGRRGGSAVKMVMASGVGARIFARAEGRYAKLLFLLSFFA